MRLEILVVVEVPFSLHQSESPRARIGEGADLQLPRIDQWSPELFALPVPDQQSVRIMHRLAVIIDAGAVVGVEQKHRGQRRETAGSDVGAGKQHDLGVEDGLAAGTDGEAKRGRRARTVEQRMDNDLVPALGRPFQPERAEQRELLAGGFRGLDRQSTGRQAIALAFGHSTEVARAEEGADLVEIVRAVDRVVDAKAGKADVLAGRFHLVEGEQLRAVADRHGAAIGHFEDVDTLFVQEAAMEKLGGEP